MSKALRMVEYLYRLLLQRHDVTQQCNASANPVWHMLLAQTNSVEGICVRVAKLFRVPATGSCNPTHVHN